MNTSALRSNNAAIEAIQSGNLAKGFNVLLRACADQNRMSKREYAENHKERSRGPTTTSHSASIVVLHAPEDEVPNDDHIWEYAIEDCSNLLLLSSVAPAGSSDHNSSSLVLLATTSMPSLHILNLRFLKCNTFLKGKNKQQLDDDGISNSCSFSWVLGYNLGILCAFMGLIRLPESSRAYYLRKSLSLLGPIHRTILKRRSTSTFWCTLKLSVLNNYILVLTECSMDTRRLTLGMALLLEKTIIAKRVEPSDAVKFQRNLQTLQQRRLESTLQVAAAA